MEEQYTIEEMSTEQILESFDKVSENVDKAYDIFEKTYDKVHNFNNKKSKLKFTFLIITFLT